LVEVTVATAVLALGVAGAVATFGVITRASGAAAEYEHAALLAEQRLTELEQGGNEALISESGDFGEDHHGFRWEQEVFTSEREPELMEVRLTVEWDSGDTTRRILVSTYMIPASETPTEGTDTGLGLGGSSLPGAAPGGG
jgi:hypothetical protein